MSDYYLGLEWESIWRLPGAADSMNQFRQQLSVHPNIPAQHADSAFATVRYF